MQGAFIKAYRAYVKQTKAKGDEILNGFRHVLDIHIYANLTKNLYDLKGFKGGIY